MSPLQLPTANKFVCLFPSKWTVSKYFLKSFIENGDLKFICTFFQWDWVIADCPCCRLPWVSKQSPLLSRLHSTRGNSRSSWLPTCLETNRVRLKQPPPPRPPIRHTSPLLLVPGFLWVCEQTHFIKPFFRGQMGNLPFPLVTRKWPLQLWRELVKLLQPTRPEWKKIPSLVTRSQAFPGALGLLRPCC